MHRQIILFYGTPFPGQVATKKLLGENAEYVVVANQHKWYHYIT
jgi:hypothetical protein